MSNTITPTVFYCTLNMEGLEIFYREAGPRDAPTVLLLYGFPSSSHMFRNLIPMLADKYHVVAPDFPGYGESSAPSVNDFDYSYLYLLPGRVYSRTGCSNPVKWLNDHPERLHENADTLVFVALQAAPIP